jgi:hypothetical protein
MLEADLERRRAQAGAQGWFGEIEGIDQTLSALRDKRADAQRLTRATRQVDLGMPVLAGQLRSRHHNLGGASLKSVRAVHVTMGDRCPVL